MEQLFNAVQDPVFVLRPDGIILEVNDATLQAAHKSRAEVVGKGICKIVQGGKWPHRKCPLEAFLKTCTSRVEETRLPGLHGEYSFIISPVKGLDSKTDKIMLIAKELTRDESRKLDSIRTAKLAAIGELAAGVAHEINNPINGIINFAQILMDNYDLDLKGIDIINRIMKESNRIATITHNLLSFSRTDDSNREPVNPVDIIEECLILVKHQLKKDGITLETTFPDQDFLITADFGQLQQVLINLISNSRYALNTRYTFNDPNKILEIHCTKDSSGPRPLCRITVKDHGTGLSQSIQERVFEPFFTTKKPGEGTGLGLGISYDIIKNQGGELRVNSIINQFTEMIIELPIESRIHAS